MKTKVLIVDDERGMRETLSDILHENGYATVLAKDGREALEKVGEEAFDVALLDIKLPDISGTKVLKALKEAQPGMEAIMITAYASLETSIEALNRGAYAYVTKPLNMEEVIATIEGALEKHDLRRALREHAEELERSNKLKDLFMDILSHDLINLLNTIYLAVELGSEKGEDTDLELIKRNVSRITDVIKNVSKYEKLESTEKLDFQDHDLDTILKRVIRDFEPSLEEKGMKLEYGSEGRYMTEVNSIIEDVFSNLISNAIKYGPEGSEIEVELQREEKGCKVAVKDRASGIADEGKERIFERFNRIEKGGVKGTGLGLAIARRVVELHNGEIWVEDNPTGGSIFYVRIPRRIHEG